MTKQSLYEVLGVEVGATQSHIKAAYKRRAQQTHPDKVGGQADEFKRLQSAYAILSDPERRARYDQTGDDISATGRDLHGQALSAMADLVVRLVEQADVEYSDIIALLRMNIERAAGDNGNKLLHAVSAATKYIKAAERLSYSGEGTDILKSAMESHAKKQEALAATFREQSLLFTTMLSLLDGYSYEHTERPIPTGFMSSRFASAYSTTTTGGI